MNTDYNDFNYSVQPEQTTSKFITVEDLDLPDHNLPLQIFILFGNEDQRFELALAPNNKAGLRVVKPLNRELKSAYHLTIAASDGVYVTTSQVDVIIDDVNDNKPVFSKFRYEVSVLENIEIGTAIFYPNATDPDRFSSLRYFLTGADADEFEVESTTGVLTTKSEIDRETKDRYEFNMFVEDKGGLQASTQVFDIQFSFTDQLDKLLNRRKNVLVILNACLKWSKLETFFKQVHIKVVDLNDNTPSAEVDSLQASVFEDAQVGSMIHRIIAVDPDIGRNGSVRYALQDSVDQQFSIEENTGVLVLRKPLDRETVSSYQLSIIVSCHNFTKKKKHLLMLLIFL